MFVICKTIWSLAKPTQFKLNLSATNKIGSLLIRLIAIFLMPCPNASIAIDIWTSDFYIKNEKIDHEKSNDYKINEMPSGNPM